MLPLKLIIEGIYSYQKRQEIDFEKLTDAGLFGIFGSTGSGKSSILEALTFVLYKNTERFNISGDDRYYNMLNLNSDKAYIEFDFLNRENEKYRAVLSLRRNSKNYEDVNLAEHSFYKFENNTWIPTEETAEDILQLSYQNFKRTIIIPQGKFKEFIELRKKGRTEMMKDIYNLHRFDLFRNVKKVSAKNERKLNLLEGELGNYQSITQEEIDQQSQAFKKAQTHRQKLQKEYSKKEQEYNALKALKEDFRELHDKSEQLNEKKKEKKDIDELEHKITVYEEFTNIFKPLFEIQKEQDSALNQLTNQKKKLSKTFEELESTLKKTEKKLEKTTPYYEQLDQKRKEENDLNLLREIRMTAEKIEKEKKRIPRGEKHIANKEEEYRGFKEELASMKTKIKKLKKQKISSTLLLTIQNWYQTQNRLNEEQSKIEKKLKQLQRQFEKEQQNHNPKNLTAKEFDAFFQEKEEALAKNHQEATTKNNTLKIQVKLAEHANSLEEGKACLLCGSTEHPEVAHIKDVSKEVQEIEELLAKINQEQNHLQQKKAEIKNHFVGQTKIKQEIEEFKKEFKQLKTQEAKHQKEFKWAEYDAKDKTAFEKQKSTAHQLEKEIEFLENSEEKKQKEEEKIITEIDRYKIKLQEIKDLVTQKSTALKINTNHLKVLKVADYQNFQPEEIQQQLTALIKKNQTVEQNHQNFTEKLEKIKPEITKTETTLRHIEENIKSLEKNRKEHSEKLEKQLKLKNTNAEQIHEVLASSYNVVEEKNKIQQFHLHFGILKNQVESLQKKLKEKDFNEENFEKTTTAFQRLKENVEHQKKTIYGLESHIKQLKKDFSKKAELLLKQEKLQQRKNHLKTISNLFRGSGFVNYVSSIYLQQLCEQANIRFRRMTRNQLSLALNESNNFDVIDYLNGGKKRSIKSLSGGQAFQASLSLALGLAESVQANNKTDRNFFFIDEGFGTQGDNSVDIVFETLMSLNKENKVVGIISHVEKLKDRISASLHIDKDPKKGSIIQAE